MAWKYEQMTGRLYDAGGTLVGVGYSGGGDGKNNPVMENMEGMGPIPQGQYTIGTPSNTRDHGPFAMPLIPDPANNMFGRSAFLMHGDSISHPGTASEGCIIMSRDVRERVWASLDHELTVVSGYPNTDTNGEINA